MPDHTTNQECAEAFLTEFDKAFQADVPWMAVVFSVKHGKVYCHRTQFNFPHADLPIAMDLLKKMVAPFDRQPDTSPLPLAPHLTNGANRDEVRSIEDVE